MENDLISRSRLRMNFIQAVEDENPELNGEIFLDLIDNAPTVTNGTYEQGFVVGAYGRLDEIRPQGEWIELSNYRHKCSICNNSADTLANLTEQLSNFCPNCGAKMKHS